MATYFHRSHFEGRGITPHIVGMSLERFEELGWMEISPWLKDNGVGMWSWRENYTERTYEYLFEDRNTAVLFKLRFG